MKKFVVILLLFIVAAVGCSSKSNIEPGSLRSQPSDDFSMGDVKSMLSKYNFYDRFRNKNGTFTNNFVDNDEETVTDFATGLLWEKHAYSGSIKWSDVDSYISKLNDEEFAGYSDWRLPTIEELASLLDKDCRPLNMSDIFTYDEGHGGDAYWSADTNGIGRAYYIDLIAATIALNLLGDHPIASIKAVRFRIEKTLN